MNFSIGLIGNWIKTNEKINLNMKNPSYNLIKTGNNIADKFLLKCFNEMWEKEVSLNLVNKEFITVSGSPCSGYFNEDGLKLICAVKKPLEKWFPVFIHEYCHYKQYEEECDVWTNIYVDLPNGKSKSAITIIDELIAGKEISKSLAKKAIRIVQNLEKDCEQRTFNLIMDYGLHKIIDPTEYIKRANAYILFHNVIIKYNKWYKKPPYDETEILSVMPGYFLNDYTKMPQKWYKLFEKTYL